MTRSRVPWIVLVVVLLPLLAGALWAAWSRTRDPLPVLDREPGEVLVVWDSAYDVTTATGEPRRYRDLVLETGGVGTIRVTMSLPVTDEQPLPLVFILAGLRTGRESLAVVPEHGNAILVGYEYPYDPQDWEAGNPGQEALQIRRAILDVPAQVVTAVQHLDGSYDLDATRSALLGYSFGALFAPATQRLAMHEGMPFAAVAMAYGGVDLGGLIDTNLDLRPRWVRRLLAEFGATAIYAMEPARHVPSLRGTFLVLRGSKDDQIPAELSQRLADLTPEPKEVVTIDAGHMGPDVPEVTEQVVRITQEWLTQIGIGGR